MAEITESKNFIHAFIEEDIAPGGQFAGKTVHTRFPPEPNGYLHIGHCKALIIDFGTAEKFGGLCNLRMDDTNPTKEDVEFVEAIQEDIHWLGFDWGDRFFYGSDYFEKDYEYGPAFPVGNVPYVLPEALPPGFYHLLQVIHNNSINSFSLSYSILLTKPYQLTSIYILDNSQP